MNCRPADRPAGNRKGLRRRPYFFRTLSRQPRHIEIQILADQHGNVVHLGERECSIQRRYQKIIEESPSSAPDPALRQEIGEPACRLAREAGYVNAGTVEFILDRGRPLLFPRNEYPPPGRAPRHRTGHRALDLVELQLRIAAGEPLPFKQEEVPFRGWAIEARICAEDPSRGFLPATGLITRYALPRGKDIRVDSGIEAGSLIGAFYDSLLAKVIAWGENRTEAIQTLVKALNSYHIEGITTNLDFVNAVLNHPAFQEGSLSTGFIETHFEGGQIKIAPPAEKLHYMVMAATLIYHNRQSIIRDSLKPLVTQVGVTHRPQPFHEYIVKGENDIFQVRLEGDPNDRRWLIRVNDQDYQVKTPILEYYRRRLKMKIGGQFHYFRLQYRMNFIWAAYCGICRTFEIYSPREWALAQYLPKPKKREVADRLKCPMPGLVVNIRVKPGDRVFRGQDLVSIESMKMESYVASPCDGSVEEVKVKSGQAVETGDVLITFKL